MTPVASSEDASLVLLGALGAGVVGLEVGCFASWCSETGRGVLIAIDAVVVVGVVSFGYAMSRARS